MPHPTMNPRKQRSPAQWAELFARFEHSALTVSAFCARESISVANFYRQRGLLGAATTCAKLRPNRAPDQPGFLDLGAIAAGGGERSRLELKIDLAGFLGRSGAERRRSGRPEGGQWKHYARGGVVSSAAGLPGGK